MAQRGTVVLTGTGKGGVGKTSSVVNASDLLASRGHRVLVIDTDLQGDCAFMFGEDERAADDGGETLLSLVAGKPWKPLVNVRPNLDLIPAGEESEVAQMLMETRANKHGIVETANQVAAAVQDAAADYDFVFIDTPPAKSAKLLLDLMLAAADWLVVPFKADGKSLRKLTLLHERVQRLRGHGFEIGVAGALFFDADSSSTAIRSQTVDHLRSTLGDDIPVFDTIIRHLQKADTAMNWGAQTIREYVGLLDHDDAEVRRDVSSGAAGLLDDYRRYVDELLEAVG